MVVPLPLLIGGFEYGTGVADFIQVDTAIMARSNIQEMTCIPTVLQLAQKRMDPQW